MGDKIRVKIDAALVAQLRALVIAAGLPNAAAIPENELLAALIRVEIAADTQPTEEAPGIAGTSVEVTSPAGTVWVTHELGLNLRSQPVDGEVVKVLLHKENLQVLRQQEDWLEVRTQDGVVGWVSVTFVTDENPHPPLPPRGNVRGLHGSAGATAPPKYLWHAWIEELKAMGIAWYKQLDTGDPEDVDDESTFAWSIALKESGIEPIIRYFQDHMFPGRLNAQIFKKMELYAAEGIVWSEIGNEPNLDRSEWHSSHRDKVDWQDPYYPRVIVENWIRDAERAVAAGVRPGFYAFAPTDWGLDRPHVKLSSVMFYRRMFEHIAANPNLRLRFRRLFEPERAFLAVHCSTYEWAPDLTPFPPGEPPRDMCLRGYEVPLRYLQELVLGDMPVEVISTEGGVFTKDSASMQGHARLSSHQEHAQRTVEMFDWLQEHSPLRAMCPWLISNVYQAIGHSDQAWVHDGWYDGGPPGFGPKPVVQAMKDTRPPQ